MADITKCTNTSCPLGDRCFRLKVKPNPISQSWTSFNPVEIALGQFECDNFLLIQ